MITGSINALGEVIVSIAQQGGDGRVLECEAIVDTGFTGLVALPRETISRLGLPRIGIVHVRYGDADVAALGALTAGKR